MPQVRFFIFLFLLLGPLKALSQNHISHWIFGTHIHVDFSTGIATPQYNANINSYEASATLSDNNGNLVMYTDGSKVWDKNHNQMPNGFGLNGGSSSTQGALLLKKPGSCSQYYLFTTRDHQGLDHALYYSIIDLNLNGGNGDVVPGSKNTILSGGSFSEKLTSVKHSNGTDYWILSHELGTNRFFAFLLSSTGISGPILSSVGPVHPVNGYIGTMRANHTGTKVGVAVSFGGMAYQVDFNASTGQFSNAQNFAIQNGIYGLEYSPNDNILYASQFWGTSTLYQIDPNQPGTVMTPFSATINANYAYGGLLLGPDGKIYMARDGTNFLGTVSFPNTWGPGAAFQPNGLILAPGTFSGLGIPNFPPDITNNFTVQSDSFSFFQPCLNLSGNFTSFISHPYDSVIWNFGDPISGSSNQSPMANPSHNYSGPGTFIVTLTIYGCMPTIVTDTITISPGTNPLSLGPDTSFCQNIPASFFLDASCGAQTYLWSNGSNDSLLFPSGPGSYQVTATLANGCTFSDTLEVVLHQFQVDAGSNLAACSLPDTFLLSGTTWGSGPFSWSWWCNQPSCHIDSASDNDPTVIVSNPTVVYVQVSDSNGCQSPIDSLVISTSSTIGIFLNPDTTFCGIPLNFQLSATGTGGIAPYFYQWTCNQPNCLLDSVNDNDPLSFPQGTTTFYCQITDSNGCTSPLDSVTIQILPGLVMDSLADYVLCPNSQGIQVYGLPPLSGSGPFSYFWFCDSLLSPCGIDSTNDNDPFIWTNTDRTYYVLITDQSGCYGRDTFQIQVPHLPDLGLPLETTFCNGDSLFIPPLPGWTILWSDSSTINYLQISYSGQYWVNATSPDGCIISDTTEVFFEEDFSFSLGPDTSICKGQLIRIGANIPNSQYYWNDGMGTDMRDVLEPGLYILTVSNLCYSHSDSIEVSVPDFGSILFVPNVFTPNNDQLNDVFSPVLVNSSSLFQLRVFDRWGKLLFANQGNHSSWDGTFRGNNAPEGVYFYTIDYENCHGYPDHLSGSVTLIR